jgi:hypothetical protein
MRPTLRVLSLEIDCGGSGVMAVTHLGGIYPKSSDFGHNIPPR